MYPTHDVVQIVDRYSAHYASRKSQVKSDPEAEAQTLSMLINPMGHRKRRIAIVAQDDDKRLLAYQRHGYETISMNGNRPDALSQFILQMGAQIRQQPPRQLIVVSDALEFAHLCSTASQQTNISIWADSTTIPRTLMEYNWHPLEELLPDSRIARLDIRVDLENIVIGAAKRGWKVDMRALAEAIREVVADLGDVVNLTGYADFDDLNKNYGGQNVSLMREWTLAGGDLRFVASQHGKNSGDMRIANDINNALVDSGAEVEIVVIVTMDRDFRHIADTIKGRGKKVVVVGLRGGLSRELENVASEVRYLDTRLRLGQQRTEGGKPVAAYAKALLRTLVWMADNRWSFVIRERLEHQLRDEPEVSALVDRLIQAELLVPTQTGASTAERGAALRPNVSHPTVEGARILTRWIPDRVSYCLQQKGMPHVDTNFLANGMTRDSRLAQLGIGQTRTEAELWLGAAAVAGLVEARSKPHPTNPERSITTWWPMQTLPVAREVAASKEEVQHETLAQDHDPTADQGYSVGATSRLRAILMEGLSDAELTTLLYDWFAPVYREVEGAQKVVRVQALLDFVRRRNQHETLIKAIRTINSLLVERLES